MPAARKSVAGTAAVSCVPLTKVEASVDLALAVLVHCTTVHGRIFVPVMVSVSADVPAGADVWESAPIAGAGSGVAGVEIVKGNEPDAPIELVTVTGTVPAKAISGAVTEAVNCVALTNVVACCAPFQFTLASLVKFVPFTVSVRPCALQDGVEAADVVEAEIDVSVGAGPGAVLTVNSTTFEISVVVVLFTFCVADCAEPGICTAICAVPAVVRLDAGTGAVN